MLDGQVPRLFVEDWVGEPGHWPVVKCDWSQIFFLSRSQHEGVDKCTEKQLQLFPCQAWRRSSWVFNWTIKCTPILLVFSVDLKFCTLSIVRHVHPKLLQATYLLSAKPFSRICYSEVFLVFTIWNQIASGEKLFFWCPMLSLIFPGTWTLQPWSTRGTRPTAGRRSRSPPPW